MVVEELLQLLISEVDAQLLKGVELQVEYKVSNKELKLLNNNNPLISSYIKDLKSSNVQHTNIVLARLFGLQGLVDSHNHPEEHLLVH